MNKKIIIGIGVFIVGALFTYAFANPSQKTEEKKDKKENIEEKVEEPTNDIIETPVIENPVVEQKITTQVVTPQVPTTPNVVEPTIVNNPVINNDVEAIIDLTDAKNKAKEELKKYADSKEITEEYLEKLNTILNTSNESIDNSTNENNINKQLEDSKKLIDKLVVDMELEQHKIKLIQELKDYYDELEFTDRELEESQSKSVLNNYIEEINDATDKDEASNILFQAKKRLEKDKFIELLNVYKDFRKFNSKFIDKANQIVEKGSLNINNEVENALDDATIELDRLKEEQDIDDAKIKAINLLKNHRDSLEFNDKFINEANNIVLDGETSINNTKSLEDININLNTYKSKLDELKAKQNLDNTKTNAIAELNIYKDNLEFNDEYMIEANNIVGEGTETINSVLIINDINNNLIIYKEKLDTLKNDQNFQITSKFNISFGTFEKLQLKNVEEEVCIGIIRKRCTKVIVPKLVPVTTPNASINAIQEKIWGIIPSVIKVTVYYDDTIILSPSIVDISNVNIITIKYTLLGDGKFAGEYIAEYKVTDNNGNRTTRMIRNEKMF